MEKTDLALDVITSKVCEIARKAGAYMREERKKFSLSAVERKHDHDYVSYVDKSSERMIVAQLQALMPAAGFVTEEGSAQYQLRYQFLCDCSSSTCILILTSREDTRHMHGEYLTRETRICNEAQRTAISFFHLGIS